MNDFRREAVALYTDMAMSVEDEKNLEMIQKALSEAAAEGRAERDEVLGLLRDCQMAHGACERPRACTACSAKKRLEEILMKWPGPTLSLS